MDSMEASDWITAGIALAALIVAVMSWWASRTSARASVTSAEAAVQSAKSSKTSADAEHALLELERQDRAEAELNRRTNIWESKPRNMSSWSIQLDASVAYRVDLDVHGAPVTWNRYEGPSSTFFRGDHIVVQCDDPAFAKEWNRNVTILWHEVETPGSEILRKDLVL